MLRSKGKRRARNGSHQRLMDEATAVHRELAETAARLGVYVGELRRELDRLQDMHHNTEDPEDRGGRDPDA